MNKSIVMKALQSQKGNSHIDVDFDYVVETFHNELVDSATLLLEDKTFFSWDFSQKVRDIVRSKQSDEQSYMHSFLSSNYYRPVYEHVNESHKKTIKLTHRVFRNTRAKFSRKTKHSQKRRYSKNNIGKISRVTKKHKTITMEKSYISYYRSGLSSVFENMLHSQNWSFPNFANTLYNTWKIPKYEMIKKFAPKSMEIHDKNEKRYHGYTFHSLDKSEAEIISGEMYVIFKMVQEFCANMTDIQKKYIECLNDMCTFASDTYYATRKYYLEREVLEMANKKYIELYSSNPPTISFDGLYLLTNTDRYQYLLKKIMYVSEQISVLRERFSYRLGQKALSEYFAQSEIINPAKREISTLNAHMSTCEEMQLDDQQRESLKNSIAMRIDMLEQIMYKCERYSKIHPCFFVMKNELLGRNLETVKIVTREHILKYIAHRDILMYTNRWYYDGTRHQNNFRYRNSMYDDDCDNDCDDDAECDDDDNCDDNMHCYNCDDDRDNIVKRILQYESIRKLSNLNIDHTFTEMTKNPDYVRKWLKIKLDSNVTLESECDYWKRVSIKRIRRIPTIPTNTPTIHTNPTNTSTISREEPPTHTIPETYDKTATSAVSNILQYITMVLDFLFKP